MQRITKHHTPTWKMCSLHNAWCCQSHTLPQESRPRLVPSSGSYTPGLFTHMDSQWTKRKGKHLDGSVKWARTSIHTHSCQHTHTHSDGTWLDVVSDDAYMLVSVRTCVLVPEADHVAKFMHHDAKLVAVLPYGDGLRAAASPSHVGAAPAEQTLTLCCLRIL